VGQLVRRLGSDHAEPLSRLWLEANLAAGREAIGEPAAAGAVPALGRPGAFGVGVFDADVLLSAAVAMPARADDGRSQHNVPGLAHISTVATHPSHWGERLAARSLEAVMSQARRRGYARCQLWTFAASASARRLYEREGFELSSRTRIHEVQGEPMVHYLRELPAPPTRARAAARVVCLDDQDFVLLMHWRDPTDGHQLWEPPGGGLEPGEGPREAVLREWAEETGLPVPELVGEPATVGRDVFWNGSRVVADETFFLARVRRAQPAVPAGFTEGETETYLGHAWVGPDDVASAEVDGDTLEPDLRPVLDRLRR
jgi:8-oxo-dGTP diphosphatase